MRGTWAEVRLQYLSNSGFLLRTEEDRLVIIDPYLTDNPATPFGPEKIPPVDLIIVSHAAFDHLGDSFYLAKRDKATLFCDIVSRQLAYAAGLPKEQERPPSLPRSHHPHKLLKFHPRKAPRI